MLQCSDMVGTKEKVQLHIRQSKTDQSAKGIHVTLCRCSVSEICPVQAMVEYLRHRGNVQGFFSPCHKDGYPLTRYQLWKLTQQALGQLGLQGWCFCTHSFHIGAASTAAILGYSPEAIKRIGRWSSRCFSLYA